MIQAVPWEADGHSVRQENEIEVFMAVNIMISVGA